MDIHWEWLIHLNFLVYCLIKTYLRSVASSIAQKVGILRKFLSIYDLHSILKNCFFTFIAPVWRSAAETHLKLLDKSLNMTKFLLPEIRVDLCHRRRIGSSSLFLEM